MSLDGSDELLTRADGHARGLEEGSLEQARAARRRWRSIKRALQEQMDACQGDRAAAEALR